MSENGRAQYLPKIRDLPASDRPRERLLQHGPNALSNAELLAILLRTGVPGESALGLGQRMLSRFSGLRGIAAASYGELSGEKGVSQAKYCHLMRRWSWAGAWSQWAWRTGSSFALLKM